MIEVKDTAEIVAQSLRLLHPAPLSVLLENQAPHAFDDSGYSKAAVYAILDANARVLVIQKPCYNDGYPWGGQIAFPGGRVEKGDKSFLETAFREVFEEVGINRQKLRTAGTLGRFPTIRQVSIEAFVGFAENGVQTKAQIGEVAQILWADMRSLMQTHLMQSYHNRKVAVGDLVYPVEGLNIWGATALIIQFFLNTLINNRNLKI